MALRPPGFIDCYGDLEHLLTPKMCAMVPEMEVIYGKPIDDGELISRLQGRRHAMVYMAYLSEPVLKACPDLQTIAYLSTGLATHVDLASAERLGIRIEGVKGYGDRAVAEYTILLMLCALRQLCVSDRNVRSGRWGLVRGQEIAGKTIGILGLGGIGRETAALCNALGATVLAWNRSPKAADGSIRQVGLQTLLELSDIVSLHLALTEDTVGFLNHDRLMQLKPGTILVNTARAALVDEAALIQALTTGGLAHAALDVFHDEPVAVDSPLLTLTNVTLTPHSAWYTDAAITRLMQAGLDRLRVQIDKFQNY